LGREQAKIKTLDMGSEFRTCPACGYENGFHNMFRKTVENGHLDRYLICPQCGGIFDIGLAYMKV